MTSGIPGKISRGSLARSDLEFGDRDHGLRSLDTIFAAGKSLTGRLGWFASQADFI